MLRATGIDHVVLRVADVRRSVAWYVEHLGVEPLRYEAWLAGEVLFASLRLDGSTIIDLFEVGADGVPSGPGAVDHVCLTVAATAAELEAAAASGDLDVEGPPALLFGARGTGLGVYVRDPDGHRLELRTYDGVAPEGPPTTPA